MRRLISKLFFWQSQKPMVAVLRLQGVIAAGAGGASPLSRSKR